MDLFSAMRTAIKLHRPAVLVHTRYGGFDAELLTEEAVSGPVAAVLTDNVQGGGGIIYVMNRDATTAIATELYKCLGFFEGRNFEPPKFLHPKAHVVEEPEAKKVKRLKKPLTKKPIPRKLKK